MIYEIVSSYLVPCTIIIKTEEYTDKSNKISPMKNQQTDVHGGWKNWCSFVKEILKNKNDKMHKSEAQKNIWYWLFGNYYRVASLFQRYLS